MSHGDLTTMPSGASRRSVLNVEENPGLTLEGVGHPAMFR